MRRLFWFSIGAALSCALLVWLLWDYSAVLFGVTLLLGAASVRLSGKYRWVRYPAAVLLGMVLGNMTETNFRRALLISDGSPKIFFSSVYCWIFIALIVVVIIGILRGKMKETKNAKVEQ